MDLVLVTFFDPFKSQTLKVIFFICFLAFLYEEHCLRAFLIDTFADDVVLFVEKPTNVQINNNVTINPNFLM